MTNITPVDAVRPDPNSTLCSSCEHSLDPALKRHTKTGTGNGPNGTDSYTCNICGPQSGTHHQGQRLGLTEPRRTTKVAIP